MSIFDRALHIPAERLFFRPQTALHERVLLPVEAGPSPRFYVAIALAGLAALACVGVGVAMLFVTGADGGARLFAVVFLVAAAIPAAVAATGIRDAMRPRPLLHVGADGVRDMRLDATPIAWTDVAGAELIAAASGIAAVRLTLAQDGAPRFNPFRIGGWAADWGGRRRSRLIALPLLDVRAHVLAHTILVLAMRHGATVEQPSPFQTTPLW